MKVDRNSEVNGRFCLFLSKCAHLFSSPFLSYQSPIFIVFSVLFLHTIEYFTLISLPLACALKHIMAIMLEYLPFDVFVIISRKVSLQPNSPK